MDKVVLGRTGLEVSKLGQGGAGFQSKIMGHEQALATLKRAFDLGVNWIDTAPGYGDSEATIGPCLAEIGAPVYVSTKLGGRPKPFNAKDADALRGSIEESLRLLHRDVIDMLLIHEPDRPGQYDWWTDYYAAEGPVMDVLDEMRAAGKVRFIGLGGTTPYALARLIATGKFDVVLTAFNYSLLWREALHEVLPEAKKQNMGVIAGSPLQQGWLAMRHDAELDAGVPWMAKPRLEQYRALYAFLDEVGMPIVEMAQRFVISNPDIDCVLMGGRTPQEVEENVASVEKGPLPQDILDRLQEIYDMVPFRPFEEPFIARFSRSFAGHGPVVV